MTVAEYIAELERRAMVHRNKANAFANGGGEIAVWGSLIEDAKVMTLEVAALLAREIEQ